MAILLRMVFAPVYYFTDPEELIGQFRNTAAGDGCFTWYQEGVFVIEYPKDRHQLVVTTFLHLMKDYIELEKPKMERAEQLKKQGEKPDMFEVPKIRRLDGARIEYFIDPYAIESEDEDFMVGGPQEDTGHGGDGGEVVEESVDLIMHEVVRRTWDAKTDPDIVKLAFGVGTLKQIGDLTTCNIGYDGRSKITVKGDEEPQVERAMAKLKVILELAVLRKSGAYVYDFHVPENEAFIEYRFLNPSKVLDRRLLAQTPRLYTDYFELSMVKWNGIISRWTSMAQGTQAETSEVQANGQTSSETCRLWVDYMYPAFGDHRPTDHEENSGRPQYLVTSDHAVAAWNETVPLDEVSDPFSTGEGTDTTIHATTAHQQPQKVYTAKRVVKGRLARPPPEPLECSGTMLPPIKHPFMPSNPEVSSRVHLSPQKEWESTVVRGGPTGDLLSNAQPVRNNPSKRELQRPNHWKDVAKTIQKDDARRLAELALKPKETVQKIVESNTRVFRRIPNLRASARQTKPEPTENVSPKVAEAIRNLLEMCRSSNGVSFVAALGRLYVKGTDVEKEFIKRGLKLEDWNRVFGPGTSSKRVVTAFSKPLSTSFVDAEFVLDVKIKNGRRMFHEEPVDRKVTFEIKCHDSKTKRTVIVEVDANGGSKVHGESETVGAVNCHFPKRVWDASFLLTSTSQGEIEVADIIQDFWVAGGKNASLGGTTAPGVRVTTVSVRRQTVHPCTGKSPLLLLHLTEVQDLVIVQSQGHQFKAYAVDEDAMVADGNRLWWEASISSELANAVLRENPIELGEVASWVAEDIVGVVPGMFELVEEVVTRMDSVGHQAVGLVPQRSKGSKTKTRTSTMASRTNGWTEW